mmetsp:Transcript_16995/g.43122  ORF Transcript_16995/g.43122 Transcript_16995/m.43122 type:complete len:217 (+) Transcript_16995:264-914(+)
MRADPQRGLGPAGRHVRLGGGRGAARRPQASAARQDGQAALRGRAQGAIRRDQPARALVPAPGHQRAGHRDAPHQGPADPLDALPAAVLGLGIGRPAQDAAPHRAGYGQDRGRRRDPGHRDGDRHAQRGLRGRHLAAMEKPADQLVAGLALLLVAGGRGRRGRRAHGAQAGDRRDRGERAKRRGAAGGGPQGAVRCQGCAAARACRGRQARARAHC